MTVPDQLLYRAYTLVEAGVGVDEAVDDLLAIANGDSAVLESACFLAEATVRAPETDVRSEALAFIGWDDSVLQVEATKRGKLQALLRRATLSAT
jgi:hypothetical protein